MGPVEWISDLSFFGHQTSLEGKNFNCKCLLTCKLTELFEVNKFSSLTNIKLALIKEVGAIKSH